MDERIRWEYKMRKIVFLCFIVLATITFGQEAGKYTLSTEYENVEYSITLDKLTYSYNETIKINFLIKNLSDTPIFIDDFEYSDCSPTIADSKIFFNLGAFFDGEFGLIHKFRTLGHSKSVSIALVTRIEEDSLSTNNLYLLEVGIGTYKYDKDLEYLTKIERSLVPVNNSKMWKLSTLYNSISLGYLSIFVQKESEN